MRFLRSYLFPFCLGTLTCTAVLLDVFSHPAQEALVLHQQYLDGTEWVPPAGFEIPPGEEGETIRYGRDLIANTAVYLGPKGIVAQLTNGMACQNCHTYAGTQNFGIPFSSAGANFPQFLERSGSLQSLESRVNDCMQRSLNGKPLDSASLEMQAIVAYIKWVGKDVPKGVHPLGVSTGAGKLSFLDRPADPEKGKQVFLLHCQRCHGQNGEGILAGDGSHYTYPPLWGDHSYNTAATLYRLTPLASFIKNNMPYGINWREPQLSDEQAWDVAAYISSQPRPVKVFPTDWKNLTQKPFDYPFAPYADSFSERQHKYGPFEAVRSSQ